jgi:hypothetical protein
VLRAARGGGGGGGGGGGSEHPDLPAGLSTPRGAGALRSRALQQHAGPPPSTLSVLATTPMEQWGAAVDAEAMRSGARVPRE